MVIHVNKGPLGRKPTDAADAAALAKRYVGQRYTVDLGPMQVKSTNVTWLGYRLEEMFEPCKNIASGARVLSEFYVLARREHENEQMALRAALSADNTDNFIVGFSNGDLAQYGIGGAVPPVSNPHMADTAVFFGARKDATVSGLTEMAAAASKPSADHVEPLGVQVKSIAKDAGYGMFEEPLCLERVWAANPGLTEDPENTGIIINR